MPASKVEMTLVDGKVYFDINQAMTLRKLIEQHKATTTTQEAGR